MNAYFTYWLLGFLGRKPDGVSLGVVLVISRKWFFNILFIFFTGWLALRVFQSIG